MDEFKVRIPTFDEIKKFDNMPTSTDYCEITYDNYDCYMALANDNDDNVQIYDIYKNCNLNGCKKHELNYFNNDYGFGCRPILEVPNWFLNYLNNMAETKQIYKFTFGEYPQNIEFKEIQKIIERKYKKYNYDFQFKKTEKNYTNLYDNESYKEYIYQNKSYIRMILKENTCTLSDANRYYKNRAVWIKNEPITWLYNVDEKLIISENILFSLNNRFLMNLDVNKNSFKKNLNEYLNNLFFKEISRPSLDNPNQILSSNKNNRKEQRQFFSTHLNYEKHNGIYLTDINYTNNPAINREKEIRELSKSLLINKSGTILIGQPGVGKTAIVEGLAYQIQNNNVCDALKNKSILSINVGNLLSGSKYRGSFEEKIIKLCDELSKNKDVILFIDEMHTVLNAGNCEESSLDMANILKQYIANDQIKMIGCTTNLEFEQYFSKDKAFRRRFNIIEIKEPDKETLKTILKHIMINLSDQFMIKLNLNADEIDYIIDLIINYSNRTLKYTYEASKNPDSSIKILTNCFAYIAIENLKEVNCSHFIAAIKDNTILSLSEMEKNNLFIPEKSNNYENIDQDIDRSKIITLKKYN